MNLVLTEKTCKVCQLKLTEYEEKNNEGLCMDCHKENQAKSSKSTHTR